MKQSKNTEIFELVFGGYPMSYKNEKEQMNEEMQQHKQKVMLAIKITFIAFAAALLALAVTFVVFLIKGGLFASGKDDTPPVIEARQGTTVVGYIGDAPTYKKYVTVSDDKDEEPKLAIDSKVEINKEGRYTVRYQAMDKAGNKSEVFKITYVVKSKQYSEDTLMSLVAELADELGITESMSTVNKVKKIYSFVNTKIMWSEASTLGESNIPNIDRDNWKSDWIEEAVRTIELYNSDSGVGDCYSYYSVSKAFFEYYGIKHVGIRRDKSLDYQEDSNGKRKGTHFWLIVDIGDGEWYYYDATRLRQPFNDGTHNACLITQDKLDSYVTTSGGTYFYKISKVNDCLDFSSAGITSFPKIGTEVIK